MRVSATVVIDGRALESLKGDRRVLYEKLGQKLYECCDAAIERKEAYMDLVIDIEVTDHMPCVGEPKPVRVEVADG